MGRWIPRACCRSSATTPGRTTSPHHDRPALRRGPAETGHARPRQRLRHAAAPRRRGLELARGAHRHRRRRLLRLGPRVRARRRAADPRVLPRGGPAAAELRGVPRRPHTQRADSSSARTSPGRRGSSSPTSRATAPSTAANSPATAPCAAIHRATSTTCSTRSSSPGRRRAADPNSERAGETWVRLTRPVSRWNRSRVSRSTRSRRRSRLRRGSWPAPGTSRSPRCSPRASAR